MKNLAYEGDATSQGGKIWTGSDRVKVEGRRAARVGDKVSRRIHGDNEIVEGSRSMEDGTTPLARDGDHARVRRRSRHIIQRCAGLASDAGRLQSRSAAGDGTALASGIDARFPHMVQGTRQRREAPDELWIF